LPSIPSLSREQLASSADVFTPTINTSTPREMNLMEVLSHLGRAVFSLVFFRASLEKRPSLRRTL
jgi:hypothetical protein